MSTLEAQTDTFILPSDKTNRFCTISESTCMEKIEEHLSFGWEQLPQDPTKGYEKEANNIMKTALAQADVRDSYLCGPSGRLATRFSSAPMIWSMGKDHKSNFPNCKLRMVQPISKSAVEKLDVITGKVLTQILPLLSFRVDSSKSFIRDCLSDWTTKGDLLHRGYHIASFDVESMYPTLPTCQTSLDVLLQYLINYQDQIDTFGFDPVQIVTFMKFIVEHTYATVDGKFYRQTKGVGTGYHSSGAFSEILIDHTYHQVIQQTPMGERPLYLKTYVDDSNHLWKHRNHAIKFLQRLNSIWPTMTFTMEKAEQNTISFLDLSITLTNEGIIHQLFQKPNHSGKYLPYSSHCEMRIKWNIVITETIRILSLCSNVDLAWPHLERLRFNLVSSGYPPERVTLTIKEATVRNPCTQQQPANSKQSYILKIPYANEATTRIVRRKASSIPNIPIKVVTTSGKTIKDIVKANLRDRITPKQPCRCDIHSKGISCDASHVVYKATCRHCEATYIGATARPLKYRLSEAEKSVRLGDNNHATGKHIAEAHHTAVLGNQARGTPNFGNLFTNYNIQVVGKAKDTLGTFLKEYRFIQRLSPELNTQMRNGFIR